jgi:putative endonuclease
MKPCVYILTNANRTVLYTGVTADIKKRVLEHRNGVGSQFTRRYNLQVVVFIEEHPTMMSAITREKQIKSWSRQRKVMLIGELNPSWRDLMPLE